MASKIQEGRAEELKLLQSLPLEVKIKKTEARLVEWYNHYAGQVYLSFSGGKDSTVLLHIIKNHPLLKDIEVVFCDTGLEYPEVKQFVKSFGYVKVIRPDMNFRQILEKYGYPVVSKNVSATAHQARLAVREGRQDTNEAYKRLNGEALQENGQKSKFNCKKWGFLLDAPFEPTRECCRMIKEKPAHVFEKQTGLYPIVATMAEESMNRRMGWLKNGCNAFEAHRPVSTPISFWTEQDIYEYILKYNVEICPIYGEVKQREDGTYYTTECERTGCVFCMFGVQNEGDPNRFQKLQETHPKLYNYCINGGEMVDGLLKPNGKGLGLGKVLDYLGIDYVNHDMESEEELNI